MTPAPGSETGRDLVRALLAGVLAWIAVSLGWLAWLFASSEDLGLFAVAAPFWAWSVGYLPGAFVLVIYVVVRGLRRRISLRSAAWAIALYLLPAAVVQGLFGLFLAGQPTSVSEGDEAMMLGALAGPLFALLYVVGLLMGFAARHRPLRSTLLAFLAPPGAGVSLAAAYFAFHTLTSPQWEGRDALALEDERVVWRVPRGLHVEAELVVKRDVPAALFHAFYRDRTERGGRGEPVASLVVGHPDASPPGGARKSPSVLRAGERYRIRMDWPRLSTTLHHEAREVILRIVEGQNYHSGALVREFRLDVDPTPDQMAALESRLQPAGPTGSVGYVTPSGRLVIPGRFDWGDEFSEGLALVRLGDRFAFIDDKGTLVIPARYAGASRFSEGLAAVSEQPQGSMPRAGYIDRNGATVIPFAFDATHPFSDGLARVRSKGKEGFIDRSGRFVIAPQWESATDFGGGLAAVKVGEHWGFIDRDGRMVFAPQFQALQPFQQGAWNAMRGGRWGRVHASGRWLAE